MVQTQYNTDLRIPTSLPSLQTLQDLLLWPLNSLKSSKTPTTMLSFLYMAVATIPKEGRILAYFWY